MFDADEAFHALEKLDGQGRLALQLAGKIHEEIHSDALSRADQAEYLLRRLNRMATDLGLGFDLGREMREWELLRRHPVTPLTRRYLTQLSERTEEVRELRERLDDALDSREQAEIRAEQAEALLEKAHWRSHCRRQPRSPLPWDDERIDQLNAEVQLLRRQLKAAREAEYVAIAKMQQERARAEAAEQKCDVLRSEVRALYYRKGRP
jgi:hypothetical protein